MIELVDAKLRDWVSTITGEVEVSFEPPMDVRQGTGVNLFLLQLVNTPSARGAQRPPLQISLRYLVTAWNAKPEQAHRVIGELMFAAMENTEFEVELDPTPLDLWIALRVAPRPSFMLRAPVRQERPEPGAKLVRQPPIVRSSPIINIEGVVVGPEGVPIMGANVEIPVMSRSTRTDHKGRFSFDTLPADPAITEMRVKAKGRELTVVLPVGRPSKEPVVIHFEPVEV